MDSMAISGVELKQPLNICRCCLSNGCYKDIYTEYYYSGQKEVYEDMLKDTFDVQISFQEGGGPSIGSRLICDNCIVRLRDAHGFKQMVLRSEDGFLEYLKGLNQKKDKIPPDPELKVEPIKEEALLETEMERFNRNKDNDDFRDDASIDDEEILANIKLELSRMEDQVLDTPMRKRKHSTERCPKKRAKIKNKDCDIGKQKPTKTEKDWLKIAERRGNGPLLRENSLKLLANSTICVFQWNKSRYRCFCCKEPFSNMTLLREHTNLQHTLENIEKKIIAQQNRLVKVEISSLHCKICGEKSDSLAALKKHLQNHDISFELDDDLLVPFKIDCELQCQICHEKFTVFRLLNIHMNRHYQKQVCHICGAGFSNLVFLNLHKTRSHRPFDCKQCNLVFKSKVDKKEHDATVHNVKYERKLRFPCPYCSERFFQENFRVQHLVAKHGMTKPEFKCTICLKVFITKSLLNNHVKNVHLKEKNHECDICHHLFYTKSDVLRHRVTHTGEKKFSCSLCNNLFATKDSLRRHMKRTHIGVY